MIFRTVLQNETLASALGLAFWISAWGRALGRVCCWSLSYELDRLRAGLDWSWPCFTTLFMTIMRLDLKGIGLPVWLAVDNIWLLLTLRFLLDSCSCFLAHAVIFHSKA